MGSCCCSPGREVNEEKLPATEESTVQTEQSFPVILPQSVAAPLVAEPANEVAALCQQSVRPSLLKDQLEIAADSSNGSSGTTQHVTAQVVVNTTHPSGQHTPDDSDAAPTSFETIDGASPHNITVTVPGDGDAMVSASSQYHTPPSTPESGEVSYSTGSVTGPVEHKWIYHNGQTSIAHVRVSGTPFAVKVILNSSVSRKVETERYTYEILNNECPFLMPIIGFFPSNSSIITCFPYALGGDLSTCAKSIPIFAMETVRFYTAEIVEAILHLHSVEIIHTNISTEHIFLFADGHIKLGGLGLAILTFGRSVTYAPLHPIDCSPPETKKGTWTFAADWWALGLVILKMFGAKVDRFQEPTTETLGTEFFEALAHCPEDAVDLIKGLLRADPIQRYGYGVLQSTEIKKHPFFKPIIWKSLKAYTVITPIVPLVRPDADGFDICVRYDERWPCYY